jgi:3-oxoacyl-(acyl-carrier-protein) synthase
MRRAVITGVGLRSPLGDSLPAALSRCLAGESAVAPLSLFDARGFSTRYAAKCAFSLHEVARVAERSGLSPRTLANDRKLVLGALALSAALADAFGETPPPSLGLSLGLGLEVLFLSEVAACYDPVRRDLDAARVPLLGQAFPLRLPLGEIARQLARLAGSVRTESFVSACAAGAQCVGEAFLRVVERGEDVVVAGACDSMLNPMGLGCFQQLGALSSRAAPDACRPFHLHRDGTVIGEGAAFFVVESWERARARKVPIYAEILGYAASLDAYRVTSPHPQGAGARSALRAAVSRAHSPSIGLVHCHGTGTIQNDPVEIRAVHEVLGDVPVCSSKGQIGHAMAAAGALELALSLSCFVLQQCPPTAHLSQIDPECAADHVTQARPFSQDALVKNSFGFGGQNAVLVLGAPP